MALDQLIRIGDVARALDITESTARYWSDWFPVGVVRVGGQRRYTKKALNKLRLVKFLLKTEGYHVDAARKRFVALVTCDW